MDRWIDLSGAPPLLIPISQARRWFGASDPLTGEYRGLNVESPTTDYDRACNAAWPGRSALPVGDAVALALYTEFDHHAWSPELHVVACGGWMPDAEVLDAAIWTDPILWRSEESEYLLTNSAANGLAGFRPEEVILVQLEVGSYRVEYAALEKEYVGCFHRFTLVSGAGA